MKVYRLEHAKTHIGIFNAYARYIDGSAGGNGPVLNPNYSDRKEEMMMRAYTGRGPAPYYDGLSHVASNYNYKYGTSSLKALEFWFDLPLIAKQKAIASEICVTEYEVPAEDVERGHTQVAYLDAAAKMVRVIPWSEVTA